MATAHPDINDEIQQFVEAQQMFFVGTAPSEGGHVNMSPKGLDTFKILSPLKVCYLDLTGSGVETIAHLRDNGRITFMFCSFTGSPNIVRLYGKGEVVRPGDAGFDELRANFGEFDAVRSVITADLDRVSDSCGYGIPLMEYKDDRRTLRAWAAKRTQADVDEYHQTRTPVSIDGLPGMSGL